MVYNQNTSIALDGDHARRVELEYTLRRKNEKARCENSYEQFVRSAWRVLEPGTPLLWNWHLTVICEEIQKQLYRVANGEPREYHLCFNVPPSSLKSMLLTRMSNAWAWLHWPWMRFISASHTQSLAEEHALDTKMLIKSQWYQDYWGGNYSIIKEQDAKSFFRTNERGQRQVTSVTSGTLGRHCHIFVCDDLLDPKKAISEADLKAADIFWRKTAQSRFVNANVGMFWVIQQRLSPKDTTGMIIERESHKYKIYCLPAEDKEYVNPPELRRRYVNGLLFPAKFPRSFLNEQKALDPVAYAAQYLQRPSPEEGDIFKQKNWRFWMPAGTSLPPVTVTVGTDTFVCDNVELPKSFDDIVISCDFAFKDKETSDNVSIDVVGLKGANKFILAENCGKKNYSKSCADMIAMKKDWPLASKELIEDKANGSAIISSFKDIIPGIFPVQASAGDSPKTRALITSRQHECGNLIAPHPDLPGFGWVRKMLDEFRDYTGDDTCVNDRITSISQAVCHLSYLKPVFEHYRQRQFDIKIDWKDLKPDMQLYISVWVEEDLSTSAIMSLWNFRTGKMAVFNEFISSVPDPLVLKVAFEISFGRITGGAITNLDRFTWVGSPIMFGFQTNKSSRRSTNLGEGIVESYRRIGINLVENSFFEENGAITTTDRMFKEGSVLIDARAPETARQPAAWCFDGKAPAAGHGCARALANLCSTVYESGKQENDKSPIPEYSSAREAIMAELNRETDPEKVGRYIKERPVFANTDDASGGVAAGDRWMT